MKFELFICQRLFFTNSIRIILNQCHLKSFSINNNKKNLKKEKTQTNYVGTKKIVKKFHPTLTEKNY